MDTITRYNLFACVRGIHRARMAGEEGTSSFMSQSLRHVARFVSDCMQVPLPELISR
jgi:hypothetical protein